MKLFGQVKFFYDPVYVIFPLLVFHISVCYIPPKTYYPFHILSIAGFPCEEEKASAQEEYTTQILSTAK